MKMFKSFLVTLSFVYCSFQPANAQIGLDLNPALLGCIMSEFKCLSNTGIPIVDLFFGGGSTPHHTDESFCFAFLENWCSGPAGYSSAYTQCRDAKKQFYKKAKIQMGEWPSKDEFERKYPTARWRPKSKEETYFDEIEEQYSRPKYYGEPAKAPYFTCTARQKHIWLKNRCSHTERYNRYRHDDHSPDVWSRMKVPRCGG